MWVSGEPDLFPCPKNLLERGIWYLNYALSVCGLCICSWPCYEQRRLDQVISRKSPSPILSSGDSVDFNSTNRR